MPKIPVYYARVQEYKFKRLSRKSPLVDYAATPSFNIKVPKASIDSQPDFAVIGASIDKCLRRHFLGIKVAIRVLSSQEHKDKSVDEIIKIIRQLGHDRYEPKRKGDRYENLDKKHIDFFALDFKVEADGEYFKNLIEPFYYWPLAAKKQPVRIDIAIVYDLSQLKVVKHRYKGREAEIKKDGFVFRYPYNKPGAILGIIKIG